MIEACFYAAFSIVCQTLPYGPGLGKVITAPEISAQEDPEQADRLQRWEEACRPAIVEDGLGVRRYVYARRGCEFGRTQF